MSVLEARRTTLADLEVLMQAATLRKVDEQNTLHLSAWANEAATAKKEQGSGKHKKLISYYKDFKDFYDYEKAEELAWNGGYEDKGKEKEKDNLFELIRKANG